MPQPVPRRRTLAVAAVAVAAIAGCAGESDPDDVAEQPTRRDVTVSHPVDEPLEFSHEHGCAVCSMTVTDYPERNAQLAHEDGTGVTFCSPGCLFAYLVAPTHFGGVDAPVAGVWVTDFGTRELVDGTAAWYVLEHDKGRTGDPMQLDPRPYADRSAATAYVDRYDDLDESDVIELADVDEGVARIYRDSRLP